MRAARPGRAIPDQRGIVRRPRSARRRRECPFQLVSGARLHCSIADDGRAIRGVMVCLTQVDGRRRCGRRSGGGHSGASADPTAARRHTSGSRSAADLVGDPAPPKCVAGQVHRLAGSQPGRNAQNGDRTVVAPPVDLIRSPRSDPARLAHRRRFEPRSGDGSASRRIQQCGNHPVGPVREAR